jgi:hypothetical protein
MKSKGSLANAALILGLSDQQIARKLGLSLAALRSADKPFSPPYLQLALAALVAGIKPDSVLECLPSATPTHDKQFAGGMLEKD